MNRILLFVLIALLCSPGLMAQITGGSVSGNFQTDFQVYQNDEKLGITDSSLAGKRTGMNAYANLLYSSNNLEAGLRFETYMPPMTGYDQRYEGLGLAHRYIRFHDEQWDFTVGNFYEQFGNGMVFRSYQDWALGVDNAMDGIRIKYKPTNGVYLKAFSGVQRYYWDAWSRDDDRGVVSGIDGEVNLNEFCKRMAENKTMVIIGGSFVSKNQKDNHPIYKIPANVAAFSGRLNLARGNVNFVGEYTYKINDPSADNGMIYKPGEGLFFQGSYAVKGFSFALSGKRIDNMSFRSDRNAGLNDLTINYLPAINKQHIYSLPAMYPYATQLNGEMGFTASVGYKIKKNTKLGGKYGTDIQLNFARITDIVRNPLDSMTLIGQAGTLGYTSDYLNLGDKYFEDHSLEIQRKLSRTIKITLLYAWIYYNIGVIEGHIGEEDVVSNHVVGDVTWRLSGRQALRFEGQHLSTEQDEGNWAMGLIEYTNKGFYASLQDSWNYGNHEESRKLHYIMVSAGYTKKATRLVASYGRQKDGIICTGGVCRFVPAISGFSMTLTTSF
ncbi:MAG: DUF6029 family protein [Bacteroidales bacterium]